MSDAERDLRGRLEKQLLEAGNKYDGHMTNGSFEAVLEIVRSERKSVRQETIEECAKVCDSYVDEWDVIAEGMAQQIRALSDRS
jgi:hypothetical protein